LDYNQLKEIPKEIGSLINLQYLYLNDNQLQEIPKEIRFLINLQHLYLNNNQLKEIPKELYNLTHCTPVGRPSHNKSFSNFYYVLYNKKIEKFIINLFILPIIQNQHVFQ